MKAREASEAARQEAEKATLFEAAMLAGRAAGETHLKQMDPEGALKEMELAARIVGRRKADTGASYSFHHIRYEDWKYHHMRLVETPFETSIEGREAFLDALINRVAEIHEEFEASLNPAEAT